MQYRLWRDLSDITYLGPRVADKIIVGLILMRWAPGCIPCYLSLRGALKVVCGEHQALTPLQDPASIVDKGSV